MKVLTNTENRRHWTREVTFGEDLLDTRAREFRLPILPHHVWNFGVLRDPFDESPPAPWRRTGSQRP